MTPESFAFLVGWATPALIGLLKRANFSRNVNIAIALGVSLVTGVVGGVLSGDVTFDGIDNPENILAAATLAFTESQIVYHTFWRTYIEGAE